MFLFGDLFFWGFFLSNPRTANRPSWAAGSLRKARGDGLGLG